MMNKYTVKPDKSELDSVVATVWEQKVCKARPSSCLSQSKTSLVSNELFGVCTTWERSWRETENFPMVINRDPDSHWFAPVFRACLGSCNVTIGPGGFPKSGTLMCTSSVLSEYFKNWVDIWFSFTCAASSLAAPLAPIDRTLIPKAWPIFITVSWRVAILSPPSSAWLANNATTKVGMLGRGTWIV